jgi:hypothetical protein
MLCKCCAMRQDGPELFMVGGLLYTFYVLKNSRNYPLCRRSMHNKQKQLTLSGYLSPPSPPWPHTHHTPTGSSLPFLSSLFPSLPCTPADQDSSGPTWPRIPPGPDNKVRDLLRLTHWLPGPKWGSRVPKQRICWRLLPIHFHRHPASQQQRHVYVW